MKPNTIHDVLELYHYLTSTGSLESMKLSRSILIIYSLLFLSNSGAVIGIHTYNV